MNIYKPEKYNSLSPYLIAENANELTQLLKNIFNVIILRKYDHANGKIAHIELQLDDSIIMLSDSSENYPSFKSMLHCYVPDVLKTFERAVENGCEIIEQPINKDGDPDTRGAFYDCAGNYWAISTQTNLR